MGKKKKKKVSGKKNTKKSKGNKKKKADKKKLKKSKKKKTVKKGKNKKEKPQPKENKYCALGRSKIYHAMNCWVIGDVSARNDVEGFVTVAKAEKAGYRPCSRCGSAK